jgi:hypothetical protein
MLLAASGLVATFQIGSNRDLLEEPRKKIFGQLPGESLAESIDRHTRNQEEVIRAYLSADCEHARLTALIILSSIESLIGYLTYLRAYDSRRDDQFKPLPHLIGEVLFQQAMKDRPLLRFDPMERYEKRLSTSEAVEKDLLRFYAKKCVDARNYCEAIRCHPDLAIPVLGAVALEEVYNFWARADNAAINVSGGEEESPVEPPTLGQIALYTIAVEKGLGRRDEVAATGVLGKDWEYPEDGVRKTCERVWAIINDRLDP